MALRSLIREYLICEGEAERAEISAIAKKMANIPGPAATAGRRDLGRTLKRMWQKEADHASFKGTTFIHWQNIGHMHSLLNAPRSRDEISAIPYNTTPWTQLRGLYKIGPRAIGAVLSGRPTLIANADMNTHAFRDGKVPYYEFPEEKQDQRRRSSGWNKYPGTKSVGSSEEHEWSPYAKKPARSWEDYLVFSASDIFPHDKITFDAGQLTEPSIVARGWPEALIDNWKVTGLVVPQSLIEDWGADELLDILQRQEIPSGLPIFDQMGEERLTTR